MGYFYYSENGAKLKIDQNTRYVELNNTSSVIIPIGYGSLESKIAERTLDISATLRATICCHKVELTRRDDSEKYRWIIENLTGWWFRDNIELIFYFRDETDATAFKLRWVGDE